MGKEQPVAEYSVWPGKEREHWLDQHAIPKFSSDPTLKGARIEKRGGSRFAVFGNVSVAALERVEELLSSAGQYGWKARYFYSNDSRGLDGRELDENNRLKAEVAELTDAKEALERRITAMVADGRDLDTIVAENTALAERNTELTKERDGYVRHIAESAEMPTAPAPTSQYNAAEIYVSLFGLRDGLRAALRPLEELGIDLDKFTIEKTQAEIKNHLRSSNPGSKLAYKYEHVYKKGNKGDKTEQEYITTYKKALEQAEEFFKQLKGIPIAIAVSDESVKIVVPYSEGDTNLNDLLTPERLFGSLKSITKVTDEREAGRIYYELPLSRVEARQHALQALSALDSLASKKFGFGIDYGTAGNPSALVYTKTAEAEKAAEKYIPPQAAPSERTVKPAIRNESKNGDTTKRIIRTDAQVAELKDVVVRFIKQEFERTGEKVQRAEIVEFLSSKSILISDPNLTRYLGQLAFEDNRLIREGIKSASGYRPKV